MFKKMLKKTVIGVTAAVLLLTGCSVSKDSDSAQPSAESGKPVTIKLNTWYNLKTDGFDQVIQEFEKKYPNIKVEFVSPGDNNSIEFVKKVDLAAASDEELDVIMLPSTWSYAQRVALGMFQPLDEYLSKEGTKLQDEYTVDTQVNGKIYGIPGKLTQWFVMMNENHLKEAGLPLPKDWTWDEYLDYAKKMTKTDGAKKRYGTYFHTFPNYINLALMNQNTNSNLVADDGKTANIMNPYMRKSLELRVQAEKDKVATPYAEVVSQKLNYRPQYFNQDASMVTIGSWMIAEAGGTDVVPATFKTVFAPYPKIKKDDPMLTQASPDILAVYSKSKHKEEAYTFIRWFTTEGLLLQGRFIPSWKQANMEQAVDNIIAKTKTPQMIDKESLLYVLKNSVPAKINIPVPYQGEVDKIMQEQFDKMMLQNQDVDTTMNTAQEKIQKLIDSKK